MTILGTFLYKFNISRIFALFERNVFALVIHRSVVGAETQPPALVFTNNSVSFSSNPNPSRVVPGTLCL